VLQIGVPDPLVNSLLNPIVGLILLPPTVTMRRAAVESGVFPIAAREKRESHKTWNI
jgi:hypothetical protein